VTAVLRILPAFLIAVAASARADYVLPTPDGGGPHPSPPSLSGTLTRVSLGTLTVQPETGDPVMVLLGSETQCWTVYGGAALVKTLPLGQNVEVWFTAETLERALSPPVAAVVRVERRE
jgi:hypothetical protein